MQDDNANARCALLLAMALGFVSLFAFFALLQFIGIAHASALTTAIGANERLCFYADVDKAGEKIGVGGLAVSRRTSDLPKRASQFYFAVSILLGR